MTPVRRPRFYTVQTSIGAGLKDHANCGLRGFALHKIGRLSAGDKDTGLGPFASENACEIANLRGPDTADFDGDENLFRNDGVIVANIETSVDAVIRVFLLLVGKRANLTQCPPLKMAAEEESRC